jgi:hypothetical protein
MSNYGIPDLEGAPRPRTTYVVCRDGSIQDHWDRQRPIGWELREDGDQWFYRVTQMNHTPKPLTVFYIGTTEDIPAGRGKIGSVVFCATARDAPQNAEITEQKDEGEEVSSRLRPPPPSAPLGDVYEFLGHVHDVAAKANHKTFEGRGDLEKIANGLNPQLAACAQILNDPVQTAAMAKFAEGKMSYAEMRGLCG